MINKDDDLYLRLIAQFRARNLDSSPEAEQTFKVRLSKLANRIKIFIDEERTWFMLKWRKDQVENNPLDFIPRTKLQVMLIVGWTLLNTFRRGVDSTNSPRIIYGGFVRDFILRNYAPNDIDYQLLPDDAYIVDSFYADLYKQLQIDWPKAMRQVVAIGGPMCVGKNNLLLSECNGTILRNNMKPMVVLFLRSIINLDKSIEETHRISEDMKDNRLKHILQIDAQVKHFGNIGVDMLLIPGVSPGVTSDVESLGITSKGLIIKCPKLLSSTSPFSNLEETIFHALSNSAVFYLETSIGGTKRRGTPSERVDRLRSRDFHVYNEEGNVPFYKLCQPPDNACGYWTLNVPPNLSDFAISNINYHINDSLKREKAEEIFRGLQLKNKLQLKNNLIGESSIGESLKGESSIDESSIEEPFISGGNFNKIFEFTQMMLLGAGKSVVENTTIAGKSVAENTKIVIIRSYDKAGQIVETTINKVLPSPQEKRDFYKQMQGWISGVLFVLFIQLGLSLRNNIKGGNKSKSKSKRKRKITKRRRNKKKCSKKKMKRNSKQTRNNKLKRMTRKGGKVQINTDENISYINKSYTDDSTLNNKTDTSILNNKTDTSILPINSNNVIDSSTNNIQDKESIKKNLLAAIITPCEDKSCNLANQYIELTKQITDTLQLWFNDNAVDIRIIPYLLMLWADFNSIKQEFPLEYNPVFIDEVYFNYNSYEIGYISYVGEYGSQRSHVVNLMYQSILHENFSEEEISNFAIKNKPIMDKIDVIYIVCGLSIELQRKIDWPVNQLIYAIGLFDKKK
jgi:hypothetical protein